jgi:hypothetical protein
MVQSKQVQELNHQRHEALLKECLNLLSFEIVQNEDGENIVHVEASNCLYCLRFVTTELINVTAQVNFLTLKNTLAQIRTIFTNTPFQMRSEVFYKCLADLDKQMDEQIAQFKDNIEICSEERIKLLRNDETQNARGPEGNNSGESSN